MRIFMWVVCILACLLAGIVFFDTVVSASGAPQQAAGAAMACAIVIIPYVLARAIEKITTKM